MRISDWSSDVCSSDLPLQGGGGGGHGSPPPPGHPTPTPPPPTPSGPAQRAGRSFGPRGSAAQTDRPHPLEGEGFRAKAMKLCGFDVGLDQPIFLIAGPCVIESMQLQLDVAGQLKEITSALGINFIFKSSFDKANRTSGTSFRGPGLEEGLKVLAAVKQQIGVPVLTDVHEYTPMDEVASVVDVLQTPGVLVRQTEFIRSEERRGGKESVRTCRARW